jgi:putative hemolysin
MSATIVGATVDWISGTCPIISPEYKECEKVGYTLIDNEQEAGNELLSMQTSGYGGLKCGKVYYGTRHDGSYIQATGEGADRYWRSIGTAFKRITRLDAAVDVKYSPPDPDFIRWCARDSHEARASVKNPWKVRFQDGYGAGDTAYIGSYSSQHFMRIYDKEKESGDENYKDVIRFEAVLRKANATSLCNELLPLRGKTYNRYIVDFMYQYCAARGIQPQFTSSTTANLLRLKNDASDRVRFTRWLYKQLPISINRAIGYGESAQVLRSFPILELLKASRAPKELMYTLATFIQGLKED